MVSQAAGNPGINSPQWVVAGLVVLVWSIPILAWLAASSASMVFGLCCVAAGLSIGIVLLGRELAQSQHDIDHVSLQLRQEVNKTDILSKAIVNRSALFDGLSEAFPGVFFQLEYNLGTRYFSYLGPRCEAVLGVSVDAMQKSPEVLLERTVDEDKTLLLPLFELPRTDHQTTQAVIRFKPLSGGTNTSERHLQFVWKVRWAGPVAYFEGMCLDVTDWVMAQREAQVADQAKTAFLATVSHEIRTPLNGIIGYTRLMEERTTHDGDKRDLHNIRETAEHLNRILNDILDFSKIEANRMLLEERRLVIRELVESCSILFRPLAEQKGLRFDVVNELADAPAVMGDSMRLRQVLSNLLSNAIKFTESGYVRLHVMGAEIPGQQLRVRFDVSDSGIGLTPAQRGQLFQRFVQGDSSTTRRFGGTGLGLSIIKGLIESMAGDIHVESIEGVGSCFSVTVMFKLAPLVEATQTVVVEQTSRMSILLVDDYDLNRRLLRRMLEKDNHQVTEAENGAIALDLAKSQAFDLILMDLEMPVMDGLDSARAIRLHSEVNQNTYICALSGLAFEEDVKRVLESGMNEHMAKPVSFDALRGLLVRVRQREAGPRALLA